MRNLILVICTIILAATSANGQELGLEFSWRDAHQATRVVDGDTLTNPLDHLISFSIADKEGILQGAFDIEHELENGLFYTNHSEMLKLTTRFAEIGWELIDKPARRYFSNRWHVEAKTLKGHVGIGVTRQYVDKHWGRGAWLARLSLSATQQVGNDSAWWSPRFVVAAALERNKDRQHLTATLTINNARFGPDDRFGIAPKIVYRRLAYGDTIEQMRQARIVFTARL